MIVGVPKEVKDNEYRVALTPSGAGRLIASGHKVIVESGAGLGSGFSDGEYIEAGAEIKDVQSTWLADIVIKVKEPQKSEYKFFRDGLKLFTFLHLASNKDLTEALIKSKTTAIAYETLEVEGEEGRHNVPILKPMSEVAGRIAVLEGCHYLYKPYGGVGILAGGIEGTDGANVVIIGGGIVGGSALKLAVEIGAQVTVLNRHKEKLIDFGELYGDKIKTVLSNPEAIEEAVLGCDLLIGAVHIPGEKTPFVVSKELVGRMQKGAVIVDVAVDQGGCVETTHPTTHSDPVFTYKGVTHYCVTNIPGAVPRTSTFALTNVSLPYLIGISDGGLDYLKADLLRSKAINTYGGKVVNKAVATAVGLEYSKF